MPDQYGTIEEIVVAVRVRLIEEIEDATMSTVRISDDPNTKLAMPSDDRWFIVSPSAQTMYDQEAIDGGGMFQTSARTRIIVTVHFVSAVDEPDDITEWFANESRSINRSKKDVIKALHTWVPVREDGSAITNDPLILAETSWYKTRGEGAIQIAFDIEFDEDFDLDDI